MRAMTEPEMEEVIQGAKWVTICTVDSNGSPYAVEATPFVLDDGRICCMINPRGGTWRNLQHSNKVLLKYTITTPELSPWIGVSCFGTGAFEQNTYMIREGWEKLGKIMNQDYSTAANSFCKIPQRTPLFTVTVTEKTGRCSAKADENLAIPQEWLHSFGQGKNAAK